LTTSFTPDGWGNITATTDPLGHVSNQTFDLDRRKLLAMEPDPGTGVRTATNILYDANGRIEVDKGAHFADHGRRFRAMVGADFASSWAVRSLTDGHY
jgi:YD repeat-containing protein